jgi:hypothetical protein
MAIKITSQIGYKKGNEIGVTNEAYVVIDNVRRMKDGVEKVMCRTFKSKTDRDASYSDVSDLQIEMCFDFVSENPDTDYTKTLAEYFGVLYGKIVSKYNELGLTTENV